MNGSQLSSPHISPEEIERLMHAARVQRAQFVRDALRALFRRSTKDEDWLHENAPAHNFSACR